MSAAPDMTPRQCSDRAKAIAASIGLAACGICRADPIERKDYVLDWLRAGSCGQMDYLRRNVDVRLDPRLLLGGARSIIVVAWLYRVAEGTGVALPSQVTQKPEVKGSTPAPFDSLGLAQGKDSAGVAPADAAVSPAGRIARYAWGRDYHRVIRAKLCRLVDQLRRDVPKAFESRICVDTAPLLEREIAQRAGLGWIGNNCLVIDKGLGSYFCLGAVVTTLEMAPDEPAIDRCGTCDRCLKACPTGALVAPKQMDSRRCISYQTIERQGEWAVGDTDGASNSCVAGTDRSQLPSATTGDWVPADRDTRRRRTSLDGRSDESIDLAGQIYGCDICQEVCPYNGPRAPLSADPDAQPRWPAGKIDPSRVLSWSQADWDAATRGRSLRRATLEMWRRNARTLMHRRIG